MHLQGEADAFPDASEVQVDVSGLSERERALIVYRHARAAEFDDAARTLKRAARRIVGHQHFTPQRIASLMRDGIPEVMTAPKQERTQALEREIQRRIGEPTRQMRQSLEALPREHRQVLLAMLEADRGGTTLTDLHTPYERLGGGGDLRQLAEDLSGHFLRIFERPGTHELAADWLHPSWRDLMIERLASKAADRRDFLRHRGVNGLLLAVSVQGAAAGQRNFPLLPGAEEVTIVQEQVRRIVFGQPDQSYRVVNLAHDLVHGRRGRGLRRAELLIEPLLIACRELWDATGATLTAGELRDWWGASVAVTPLPASPNLGPTWSGNECARRTDRRHAALRLLGTCAEAGPMDRSCHHDPAKRASVSAPSRVPRVSRRNLEGRAQRRRKRARQRLDR
jgi:hypothetical protein